MTDATKTPEQLAAEAAAAATQKATDAAAAKQKAKDEKAAASAAAKKAKEDEKAAAKTQKDAAAAEAKAKKDKEVADKAALKAAADKAKEATKMPEQNGVRRPKAEGACGKVWALADSLSATLGQPVPIANLSAAASAAGINDSTIRTQYALWRKFFGITGRVALPVVTQPVVSGGTPAA